MAKVSGLGAQLFKFDRSKIEYWIGARAALGMTLSLLIGQLMHSPAIGLSIAIGALNTAFSDQSDAYLTRAKRMLNAALVSGLVVFAAALAGNSPPVMFTVLILGAFFAGMLVAVDNVAADLGTIGIATFLIFSAQPMDSSTALHLSLFAFAGGLMQVLVGIALWPLRRYRPERRALSNLFQDLAFLCVTTGQAHDEPLGSVQSTETQKALNTLARDDRNEARRYRSLLSQGERLRITVLSLFRLRKRLQREGLQDPHAAAISEILNSTSQLLRAISQVIISEEVSGVSAKLLNQIDSQSQKIRQSRDAGESPFLSAVLNDLSYQLEALAGQLRAAIDLTLKTTQVGAEKAELLEASRPLKLRFRGVIATMMANMTFKSPAFRHAIRLSVCLALGEILTHVFKFDRPYWVPMTIVIVLKPDFASTFSRGLLRVAGTLAGLLVATCLLYILPATPWTDLVLIVAFIFFARSIGSANYGFFAMCVGALVVLLIAQMGGSPHDVIMARGINTFVGGMLALLVYWLWPTSEKLQLSEVVARMLETYRQYYAVITQVVLKEPATNIQALDRLRQQARVARFNFQVATNRYAVERGSTFEDLKTLSAVTAAANRFAHSIMAVEAGSSLVLNAKQAQAFREFSHSVDVTLDLLGKALRGEDVLPNQYPDVRAAFVKFAESKQQDSEQYSLMFEETDRMTNSLVTLSEQVKQRFFMHKIEEPQTALSHS